jgi:acetyl esterase/lipase
MNSDGDDARLAAMAMPDLAADDHDASPLLADLSGVPPTFVTASTDEVLLDDALLLIRALARAGVPVTAEIVRGAWHLWPLWATELRAADLTLHRIARFLREVAADAGC